MAKSTTSDTVDDNGVEEQVGEQEEQSDLISASGMCGDKCNHKKGIKHHCSMCTFLFEGYGKAHSKQAKAEYGEGFLVHFTKFHKSLWDEIN